MYCKRGTKYESFTWRVEKCTKVYKSVQKVYRKCAEMEPSVAKCKIK